MTQSASSGSNGLMNTSYQSCCLCGRQCGTDRTASHSGFCGMTDTLRLAWAGLHFGEEPPVTGTGGSGTVFFSGCTLGCPFCQNYQISRQGMGRDITDEEFLSLARKLKEAGAENLNLVTPSHFLPSLKKLLPVVREMGLPVVWNSSAQESVEALEEIFPLVDIFLPDLKTLDARVADRYYRYRNYPEIARQSIKKMAAQKPLVLDERGVMKQGVMVRHLVLPGEMESTRQVFRWFSENLKDEALLSVMSQYTPVVSLEYPEPDPSRYLNEEEYDEVMEMLEEYDLEEGFIQEWITGSDWLPDFNKPNPFSSELSRKIWHWKEDL